VDWIHCAQDKVWWQAFVCTVMNPSDTKKALISWLSKWLFCMKSAKKSVLKKYWYGSKYSGSQCFIASPFNTLQCHFLMFIPCLCDRKGMVQVMCWLPCRERNVINYVERMMTSPLSPGCRTRICSKVKHCMVHCANYTLNEYLIPADHWAWCFTTQHI